MEENKNKILQESREKEIPNIINEYKKLGESILKQVGTDIPLFKNIEFKDKDGEFTRETITAEEQLYNFLLMREKAVDHVDRLYIKVNNLELEKNNPEAFKALQSTDSSTTSQSSDEPKKNPVKSRIKSQK